MTAFGMTKLELELTLSNEIERLARLQDTPGLKLFISTLDSAISLAEQELFRAQAADDADSRAVGE